MAIHNNTIENTLTFVAYLGHPDTNRTLVDISWITGTVEAWIAGSRAMAKTGVGAFHTMQPTEILIKSDRAIATSLISPRGRIPYKGCDLDLTAWGHQLQRFEKVGGIWKIVRFQAIYIRGSVSTPCPGTEVPPIDEKGEKILREARSSFKWLAWQMSLIGETVRNDLPGYDDESSWKPLVDSNEKWLETGED